MNSSAKTAASDRPGATPMAITHYENFPVASWLCPPRLRAPIAAIYHFARTADDLADEGDAAAEDRLADLASFRADLAAIAFGTAPSTRWRHVFDPLAAAVDAFALPVQPLTDLLSAFEQDVHYTRDAGPLCRPRRTARLLPPLGLPCRPPVAASVRRQRCDQPAPSDDICAALQLINFWQDLSLDMPRGRHYLPVADCTRFCVTRAQLDALEQTDAATRLIADEVRWARELMLQGARIVHRRAGPRRLGAARWWCKAASRLLDKIVAMRLQTLARTAQAAPPRCPAPAVACGSDVTIRIRPDLHRPPLPSSMTPEAVRPAKSRRLGQQLLLRLPVPAASRAAPRSPRSTRSAARSTTWSTRCSDPGVARTKLAWWRTRGRASPSPASPRHPGDAGADAAGRRLSASRRATCRP